MNMLTSRKVNALHLLKRFLSEYPALVRAAAVYGQEKTAADCIPSQRVPFLFWDVEKEFPSALILLSFERHS
jgi:hypothetical protein